VLAAHVVEGAILAAVKNAEPMGGLPSYKSLKNAK